MKILMLFFLLFVLCLPFMAEADECKNGLHEPAKRIFFEGHSYLRFNTAVVHDPDCKCADEWGIEHNPDCNYYYIFKINTQEKLKNSYLKPR